MTPFKRSIPAILFAALLCAPPALAQNPNLPFKPGAWVIQVTLNKGTPTVTRACFTAGTNLDNYLAASNRGLNGTVCTVSNKTQQGREISFDNACTSGTLTSQAHIDFQSPDDQHFTGTTHIVITGTTQDTPPQPVNRTNDREYSAKFDTVDCGTAKVFDITPPKPK